MGDAKGFSDNSVITSCKRMPNTDPDDMRQHLVLTFDWHFAIGDFLAETSERRAMHGVPPDDMMKLMMSGWNRAMICNIMLSVWHKVDPKQGPTISHIDPDNLALLPAEDQAIMNAIFAEIIPDITKLHLASGILMYLMMSEILDPRVKGLSKTGLQEVLDSRRTEYSVYLLEHEGYKILHKNENLTLGTPSDISDLKKKVYSISSRCNKYLLFNNSTAALICVVDASFRVPIYPDDYDENGQVKKKPFKVLLDDEQKHT